MGLNSNNLDDSTHGDSPVSNAHEEKIYVSIRLRPLNEKELASNDVSDWECINNNTILFKNSLSERSTSPTAYSFDRVFESDCSTRKVYEEAAKGVALSVVSGINSSIFAYGQTSSGKTYTMSGITDHTVADIYDYIDKNTSRKFTLKFSAMEIYNEAVRDLLSSDDTPLRLLDDPDRGTVVEKLTEVTLRDRSQLKELLSFCEAQRKIGETNLNEMSSRSHQILRLTIESSAREYKRFENSSTLAATVNFIDLAGSERASQTLSAGTRLKEGCHINRSLLTLGTVIRKLSKGRNGHVPYRDSKLTRILQNSLGGNARTAIICTMSPAHTHVEQSRNTLLFASCAKQVSTNALVNVMMSEKTLIKQLQRELARLESQLKNLGSLSTSSGDSVALKEKELLIEKMEKEIRDLTQQRDQAHFSLQNFTSVGEYQVSKQWDEQSSISENQEKVAWFDEYSASEASDTIDPLRLDGASSASHFSDRSESLNLNKHDEQFPEPSEEQFLSDDTSPRLFIERYFGPDPTQGWEKTAQRVDHSSEDLCKEVQCIEIDTSVTKVNLDTVPSQGNENQGNVDTLPDIETPKSWNENQGNVDTLPDIETPKSWNENQGNVDIHNDKETLKQTVEDTHKTIKCLDESHHRELSSLSDSELMETKIFDLSRSKSSGAVATTMPLSSAADMAEGDGSPSTVFEKSLKQLEDGDLFSKSEPDVDDENLKRNHSEPLNRKSINEKQQIIMSLGLDDAVAESEKQFRNDMVPEAGVPSNKLENDSVQVLDGENDPQKSPSNWCVEFEKQRAKIIQFWEACNIPIVHRSYFYLVFRGDPSDAIYMEVELRRLSYLKVSQGNQASSDSMKALNRERDMLSKLMLKKFSTKERDSLFEKWGIKLKTKKRRLQLCRRLWTDTKDMQHIEESAALVAKLVGLVELGQVPKEIVGLSFSAPQVNAKSFSWKHSIPSLV